MGEAKRRKDLGLKPKSMLIKNFNKISDRYISWLPITKNQMSKYPYLPVASMALGLILILIDWSSLSLRG